MQRATESFQVSSIPFEVGIYSRHTEDEVGDSTGMQKIILCMRKADTENYELMN